MADPIDTTRMSDEEFLRHYGVGANLPPGTLPAVQPPLPEQSGIQNALTRYGSAAARGAAWNIPGATATLGVGALTGPGMIAAAPLAVGELAVGALGGIAGQAAEDLGAPAWVGPAIGAAAGLGAGGVSTVGRGLYQLGSRIAASPFGGHTILGGAIGLGEQLTAHILGGAAHISSNAGMLLRQGLAAGAITGGASVVAGARNLLRPVTSPSTWQAVRDFGLPFAGAVGGAVGPEGPNASAPLPPRRSSLELSQDQPGA